MGDDRGLFGESVRRHRLRLGLTQEDLAARSGLGLRTLRDIETGRIIRPRPATVRLLADAFGLADTERAEFHQSSGGREAAPAADGVPAQLPAPPAVFIGRRGELDRLGSVASLAVVSGPPGVGKSALAVHWGHTARDRFPDGHLYLNLRGFNPDGPMSPDEALRTLLVGLVPADRVPDGLDARSALLRSVLAGRRMLLVLDNARDAGQVRPLLPGETGCTVVVTSRSRLSGLLASHGATPLMLEQLRADEAEALLTRRLRGVRVPADPAVVRALAEATGRLPLALVTVAARAATSASLASIVGELAESRLDGLRGLDATTDPRNVISWSYRALSPAGARLFRLLGIPPGPDISTAAAHSLNGGDAGPALDELTAASLLTEHRPGRYALHDLVRDYAATLAAPDEAAAARQRLAEHYLRTGRTAAMLLDPRRRPLVLPPVPAEVSPEPIATEAAALAWFAAEHVNLMALLRHPAGLPAYAWQLPWTMVDHLDRRGYWDDWIVAERVAVQGARRAGDPHAEAFAHQMLARAYVQKGRFDEAETSYDAAIERYALAGDLLGQASTLHGRMFMWERRGRPDRYVQDVSAALEAYRRIGHRLGEARALNSLGWHQAQLGDRAAGLAHCQAALALLTELDDRTGQASTWDSIGWIHHQDGRAAAAISAYEEALALFRQAGDLLQQSEVLEHLGDAYAAAHRPAEAATARRRALAILDGLGHPDAARVRARRH
ncbi:ATP-binding protein [Hamadaea tsunoensis]|uniref:ATP-binding protein n=1 Tax=Hamadaea tsunoensis TaxID=53368 RepID=UPI0009FD7BF0|nr:XRE family transcriptional regulator [Hamadaea tsunoensis]